MPCKMQHKLSTWFLVAAFLLQPVSSHSDNARYHHLAPKSQLDDALLAKVHAEEIERLCSQGVELMERGDRTKARRMIDEARQMVVAESPLPEPIAPKVQMVLYAYCRAARIMQAAGFMEEMAQCSQIAEELFLRFNTAPSVAQQATTILALLDDALLWYLDYRSYANATRLLAMTNAVTKIAPQDSWVGNDAGKRIANLVTRAKQWRKAKDLVGGEKCLALATNVALELCHLDIVKDSVPDILSEGVWLSAANRPGSDDEAQAKTLLNMVPLLMRFHEYRPVYVHAGDTVEQIKWLAFYYSGGQRFDQAIPLLNAAMLILKNFKNDEKVQNEFEPILGTITFVAQNKGDQGEIKTAEALLEYGIFLVENHPHPAKLWPTVKHLIMGLKVLAQKLRVQSKDVEVKVCEAKMESVIQNYIKHPECQNMAFELQALGVNRRPASMPNKPPVVPQPMLASIPKTIVFEPQQTSYGEEEKSKTKKKKQKFTIDDRFEQLLEAMRNDDIRTVAELVGILQGKEQAAEAKKNPLSAEKKAILRRAENFQRRSYDIESEHERRAERAMNRSLDEGQGSSKFTGAAL